ncbi:hypothetical protein F5X97DRAFT_318067 [Nemania serpens]|nr:hypothetical protein F5X97DRAFT_318067 [Nemania serpens]
MPRADTFDTTPLEAPCVLLSGLLRRLRGRSADAAAGLRYDVARISPSELPHCPGCDAVQRPGIIDEKCVDLMLVITTGGQSLALRRAGLAAVDTDTENFSTARMPTKSRERYHVSARRGAVLALAFRVGWETSSAVHNRARRSKQTWQWPMTAESQWYV